MKTAEEIYMEVQDAECPNINNLILPDEWQILAMEKYTEQFKTQWISVCDSRPKDHNYVLVSNYNGTDIAQYKHGCFFIDLKKFDTPTHWMPLPEPPTK